MKMPLQQEREDCDVLRVRVRVPSGAQYAQTYTKTDSGGCPRVWARFLEELANVERFSGACRQCGHSIGAFRRMCGIGRTGEEQVESDDY